MSAASMMPGGADPKEPLSTYNGWPGSLPAASYAACRQPAYPGADLCAITCSRQMSRGDTEYVEIELVPSAAANSNSKSNSKNANQDNDNNGSHVGIGSGIGGGVRATFPGLGGFVCTKTGLL